jgi:hypothetical protein
MKEKNGKAKRPAYVKRIGALKVSVWENDSDGRIFHNLTIVRSYKDGDEWKESNSLSVADMAALKEALIYVGEFVSRREDELNGAGEE